MNWGGRKSSDEACLFMKKTLYGLRETADTYFDL